MNHYQTLAKAILPMARILPRTLLLQSSRTSTQIPIKRIFGRKSRVFVTFKTLARCLCQAIQTMIRIRRHKGTMTSRTQIAHIIVGKAVATAKQAMAAQAGQDIGIPVGESMAPKLRGLWRQEPANTSYQSRHILIAFCFEARCILLDASHVAFTWD